MLSKALDKALCSHPAPCAAACPRITSGHVGRVKDGKAGLLLWAGLPKTECWLPTGLLLLYRVQDLAMRVPQLGAATPDLMGSWRRVKPHVKRERTSHLAPQPRTQHQLFVPQLSQDGGF